jgi:glycosyltransferase involved in cell wall biosynthesis
MSGKSEVSVVMSVYNGAPDLADTMKSILSQEEVDFEFIVVNDGSSDQSGQILNDFAQRDGRLRIIHQENTGLTRALIRGCEVARSEFIARQDAGDISLPGRLKSQVAVLRDREDCAFVSCWTDVVGPKGEFLYTSRGTGLASCPVNILSPETEWGVADGPTHHSSVMFRAKQYALCGGYRPEFYFGQDWDLWYRLASLGTFCTLQKRLCVCSVTLGSISASRKEDQERFARLSRKAFLVRQAGLSDQPVLEEARQLVSAVVKKASPRQDRAAANYFVGRCLLDNRNAAAIEYLMSAIKENPLHLRAWIGLARSFLPVSKTQAL